MFSVISVHHSVHRTVLRGHYPCCIGPHHTRTFLPPPKHGTLLYSNPCPQPCYPPSRHGISLYRDPPQACPPDMGPHLFIDFYLKIQVFFRNEKWKILSINVPNSYGTSWEIRKLQILSNYIMSLLAHLNVTVRQRSCGKVMFSLVPVCSQGVPVWPLPMMLGPHCIGSLQPCPQDIRHGTPYPPASDNWWQSLETRSNLFISGPSPPHWY